MNINSLAFQVKTKKGSYTRKLLFVKIGKSRYTVKVDDQEIGTIWKGDGQVKKFRNHRLVGSEIVDRWFAKTVEGKVLGEKPPYDEAFGTREEAVINLIEAVFKYRRDYK